MPHALLPTPATLQHQAHLLGEALRTARATAAHTLQPDPRPVHVMEAELSALWTAIRRARAAA